jgi:hypothetical protein
LSINRYVHLCYLIFPHFFHSDKTDKNLWTLYNKTAYFLFPVTFTEAVLSSLLDCRVRLGDVSDELGTNMAGDGPGPLTALFWNFPGETMENHAKCVSDGCWGRSSVTAVLWCRRWRLSGCLVVRVIAGLIVQFTEVRVGCGMWAVYRCVCVCGGGGGAGRWTFPYKKT